MADIYRDRAERPTLGPEERRWFTKRDEEIKGPFEEDVLVRTVQAGKLLRSTLVRMEGETDWRALKDVPELEQETSPIRANAGFPHERRHKAQTGSYGTGLAVGLFTGLLGLLVVVLFVPGTETRRGARNGMWIQWLILLLIRAVMALLAHQRSSFDL